MACQSTNKGATVRLTEEEPCPYRTAFQRDRDRILHCSAFRRLKHKTQVFLSPVGDHYRTRLTHTLEVSQIARTIAKALFLNEELTEAIALGHDIGHSPFGHAGEAVLNQICPHHYRHYEQSVRVADVIEKLNLTYAVRDGILCHTNKIASILFVSLIESLILIMILKTLSVQVYLFRKTFLQKLFTFLGKPNQNALLLLFRQ